MLDKILSFYTKLFALWVTIFAVAAYLFPAPFTRLESYMDWFFALTMFGIGAVLQTEDFKKIAKKPLLILLGCGAQYTIMPLGAFFIAKMFSFPPEIAVGLILTGSAPGAMASNVMSYIAKADIAYSISLTTVSTLLCPILTPGLTYFLAGSTLKVNFWAMVISVTKMVLIPLAIGFLVRYLFKKKINKILKIFPAISVTFIILICSMVIALNKNYILMVTAPILIAAVILNLYGMASAYGLSSALKMETKRRKTLTIEIGMQNAGLGTILALKHFSNKAAIPAAVFVFVCIITASILAELWQKNSKSAAAQPSEN